MEDKPYFYNRNLFDSNDSADKLPDSSEQHLHDSPNFPKYDKNVNGNKSSLNDLLSNLHSDISNVKSNTLTKNDINSLNKTMSLLATLHEELSEQNFNHKPDVFETFKGNDKPKNYSSNKNLNDNSLKNKNENQTIQEENSINYFNNEDNNSADSNDKTELLLDNQKLRIENKRLKEMLLDKENKILSLEEKIVNLDKQLMEYKITQSQRKIHTSSVITQAKNNYPSNSYSMIHRSFKKK